MPISFCRVNHCWSDEDSMCILRPSIFENTQKRSLVLLLSVVPTRDATLIMWIAFLGLIIDSSAKDSVALHVKNQSSTTYQVPTEFMNEFSETIQQLGMNQSLQRGTKDHAKTCNYNFFLNIHGYSRNSNHKTKLNQSIIQFRIFFPHTSSVN